MAGKLDDPIRFIHELITVQDELSWRDVLLRLVKSGQLDPWDVDISLLTQQYLQLIHQLKALDFTISGNMLLAAALLVKMKTDYFLEAAEQPLPVITDVLEDLPEIEEFYEMLDQKSRTRREKPRLALRPRTPQRKTRRVSIYELIDALEEAMRKAEARSIKRQAHTRAHPAIELPEETVDMHALIADTLKRIEATSTNGVTTFSNLLNEESREEKVYTFLPLLHLAHVETNRVSLEQENAFTDILIRLKD